MHIYCTMETGCSKECVCAFHSRYDGVCALEILADAAKTNVVVLIALQDIARGSRRIFSTCQKTTTSEGN